MSRSEAVVRAKSLRALLADSVVNAPDVDIVELTLDSREVRPGGAFVALPGTRTHGLSYLQQAIALGARAILWEPAPGVSAPTAPAHVETIEIPGLTRRLGSIAARFFEEPSRSVRVLGVTGTNGKTTTAHLIAAALEELGAAAAYAGTLGFGRIGALETAAHTTPDAITVHRRLAELRERNVAFLAMEVSSHAIDQHRIAGVRFETAVFTNLTRDHLDYHGSFEAYGAVKARLFERPALDHAVINIEDAYGRELVRRSAAQRLTLCARSAQRFAHVGAESAGKLFASVSPGPHGLDLDIDGSYGAVRLQSRFIGEFNADNLLIVLATLLGAGAPLEDAIMALERCSAPPGRMETHSAPRGPLAVVDYAHTPDALEKALMALRSHCAGRLICVFGCGGERDPGKRPLMGAVAERLADRIIVTDDNPRGEDGDLIVADIVAGLIHPQRALLERDRAAAIERAIREAQAGDVVLIAGKGHEDYQVVGAERRRFSDRDVVRAALGRRS